MRSLDKADKVPQDSFSGFAIKYGTISAGLVVGDYGVAFQKVTDTLKQFDGKYVRVTVEERKEEPRNSCAEIECGEGKE